MLPESLAQDLTSFAKTEKRLTVLTGAGISAESGIPTFRGKGGLWEKYDSRIYATLPTAFYAFLKEPQKFSKLGGKIPKGVLLDRSAFRILTKRVSLKSPSLPNSISLRK